MRFIFYVLGFSVRPLYTMFSFFFVLSLFYRYLILYVIHCCVSRVLCISVNSVIINKKKYLRFKKKKQKQKQKIFIRDMALEPKKTDPITVQTEEQSHTT